MFIIESSFCAQIYGCLTADYELYSIILSGVILKRCRSGLQTKILHGSRFIFEVWSSSQGCPPKSPD